MHWQGRLVTQSMNGDQGEAASFGSRSSSRTDAMKERMLSPARPSPSTISCRISIIFCETSAMKSSGDFTWGCVGARPRIERANPGRQS